VRRPPTFVVVGAGLAGGTAAATLREEGFDGRVVLLGDEPLAPYERPPLSKEYLRGERSLHSALLRPPGWYDDHGIDARFGQRAEHVDVTGRSVRVSGGGSVRFDAALIATGVRNRRIDVPGSDLPGVFQLRTAADARSIRDVAASGGRAVVVGMGFTGAEVAASLRALGLDVTVVEVFSVPLERAVGPEIGAVYREIHREHGVRMLFRDSLERFVGGRRLEGAITGSGRRLECDLAVVAVGTTPAGEATAAVARSDGGIHVDERLETETPGIFAAGDVAAHRHPLFGRIRVEHYDTALKMGAAVARNMLGRAEAFGDAHWFWSDQYDTSLEAAGSSREWDARVVRGSLEARRFAVFYLLGGIVRGVTTMNYPRIARRSLPLIEGRRRPDPAALADDGVDVRVIARSAPEAR
jgi:3-phenylpropionate/trans-cinnamate dioxygenase ferredoxin reductase component